MIKLVVDSASDINKKEAEKLGIELLSMEINFDSEQYLDGDTLHGKEFFEKLIECDNLPKTSQINEYTFDEKFRELTEKGYDVICITMSSKLSGTYNCACNASKKYNSKVCVIDSLNASIGERILINYALELIRQNLEIDSIVKILDEKKKNIQLIALLNTLKYLQKGGRISAIKAFTGELLNMKPVISIIDGEVKLIGKAMGSKKGNNLLVQIIEKSGVNYDMPFATAYSGLSDDILEKYLSDSVHLWQGKTKTVPKYMIGSTIGTHVGPGAIAVAYFDNK